MLVTAIIGHNMKSNDLINIPHSRDAITSTCANILKDNRSSFMIDSDGSPNHDVSLSVTHASAKRSPLLRQSRTLPSAVNIRPLQLFVSVTVCKNMSPSRMSTMDIIR